MLLVTVTIGEDTMGAANRYLGHIEIIPPLDQAEDDHLRAVSRGEVRLVGPDGVEPWCPWGPCAHGCCLRWNGGDSHGTGAEGLQLLIDRFLSPDDPVASLDDSGPPGFTFEHDTNGAVACEDGERGLFLLRVDHGKVGTEMLLRGDPSPWDPATGALRELPRLSPELSPDERNRRHNEATLAKLRSSSTVERG